MPRFVPTQPRNGRERGILGRVNIAGRYRDGAVPGDCNLSDAEVETLRDSLYCLAAVAVDGLLDRSAKGKALSAAGNAPTEPLLTFHAERR